MSERRHHSSGTEWEARIGYARAIRVGDTIHVSGTLGVGPDGRPPDGAYAQSVAALEAIGARFEGIHRRHMLVRGGELRDSAWYSVIDDDWPATKAALAERVAGKEAG